MNWYYYRWYPHKSQFIADLKVKKFFKSDNFCRSSAPLKKNSRYWDTLYKEDYQLASDAFHRCFSIADRPSFKRYAKCPNNSFSGLLTFFQTPLKWIFDKAMLWRQSTVRFKSMNPRYTIHMYWNNFCQPTVRVQQNH